MSGFLLDENPKQLPCFSIGEEDPERYFGRLCAGVRRSLGMSQEELASKVGLDLGQLEALETGLISQDYIPRKALVELAAILLAGLYRRHRS